MRIKVARKFLPLVIAGVLLVALVPLVSAFEAYAINVTAHVEQPFAKTIRLATDEEIADSGIAFPNIPNPPGVTDPYYVPDGTCVVWMVTITFTNFLDYKIHDVMVKDNFGAELTGMAEDSVDPAYGVVGNGIYWITDVSGVVTGYLSEDAGPVLFYYMNEYPPPMPQFRIFWYATYEDGDPHLPQPVKHSDLVEHAQVENSGSINPGESTTLNLLVWTRINPGQGNPPHQEYTSPGEHEFNSGPTVTWLDPEGNQGSISLPSLKVESYEP